MSKGLKFYLLVPFLLVLILGIGCGDSKRDLDKEVVKVEINGHHFDVPLRYMYGEAVEKRGNWPKTKKERVKADYLSLSMLLPNLRPYYPEDDVRWKVRGHGERVMVSITKPVGSWDDWFPSMLRRMEKNVSEGRFYHKEAAKYGLAHFSGKVSDDYFAEGGAKIHITCDKEPELPSPSCMVKSNYRPGLVLSYSYAVKYLPQWKEIDDGLKAMFDEFAQAAEEK